MDHTYDVYHTWPGTSNSNNASVFRIHSYYWILSKFIAKLQSSQKECLHVSADKIVTVDELLALQEAILQDGISSVNCFYSKNITHVSPILTCIANRKIGMLNLGGFLPRSYLQWNDIFKFKMSPAYSLMDKHSSIHEDKSSPKKLEPFSSSSSGVMCATHTTPATNTIGFHFNIIPDMRASCQPVTFGIEEIDMKTSNRQFRENAKKKFKREVSKKEGSQDTMGRSKQEVRFDLSANTKVYGKMKRSVKTSKVRENFSHKNLHDEKSVKQKKNASDCSNWREHSLLNSSTTTILKKSKEYKNENIGSDSSNWRADHKQDTNKDGSYVIPSKPSWKFSKHKPPTKSNVVYSKVTAKSNTAGNNVPVKSNIAGNKGSTKSNIAGNKIPAKPNTAGNKTPAKPITAGNKPPAKPKTAGNQASAKPNTAGNQTPAKPNAAGKQALANPNTAGNQTPAKPSIASNKPSDNSNIDCNKTLAEPTIACPPKSSIAELSVFEPFPDPREPPFTVVDRSITGRRKSKHYIPRTSDAGERRGNRGPKRGSRKSRGRTFHRTVYLAIPGLETPERCHFCHQVGHDHETCPSDKNTSYKNSDDHRKIKGRWYLKK